MKRLIVRLLAIFAAFALGQTARADSVSFTFAEGGQGLPSATSYASGTLSLNTTDPGCTGAGKPCIQVSLTAAPGFFFWDQTGGGVFGFNDSTDSSVYLLNCSSYLTSCSPTTVVAPGSNNFIVGTYEFSVGNSSGNGLCYTSSTNGCTDTGGSAAANTPGNLTFDVLDANPADPFTSVSQLEFAPSGQQYDFGAHICQQSGSTADCAETSHPTGNSPYPPEHAYVGGNPTPEPASYLLFGSGLLFLGGLLRKRIESHTA